MMMMIIIIIIIIIITLHKGDYDDDDNNNNNNNNMYLQQTDLHIFILDSWMPLDPCPCKLPFCALYHTFRNPSAI